MGLLQVMPQTAAELGVGDPWDPESNIHAGVKYMAWLLLRFETTLPMRQRIRFALASYNAGLGHVRDARRLAKETGLNPDRWFGNVEKAIVLLEKQKFYKRARHGYCRGSEPAQYVSRIQTKYDAYSRLMPAEGK
jgi:membrane-bound lytic murein transglycosylase F